MTTAATSLLGLALPVTGELSGTWGDTVNNSITALLDSAVAGTTTLSADADVTLTTTTLAANQAREAIILWTAGGTVTRNITAPAQSKTYVVLNKTSSTQSIVIRGAGPTTGVTVLAGKQAMVAWDGTDFVEVSSGYVDGPASSTDNAVARFDGTDGKTIQNSVVIIADTTGNMSGVGTLSSGAITSSSLTATRVLFAGTAGLIQDDADLTFNGTILTSTGFAGPLNGTVGATTANTGAFTTLSTTGAVTITGGTANGVAYLNGSKVLTTGSALTFDGTNLGVAVTPSTWFSTRRALQIGQGASVSASTNSSVAEFSSNVYIDAAGSNIYVATGTASRYQQSVGAHNWSTAVSGTAGAAATLNQVMVLDATGNLGLGATPSAWGSGFRFMQFSDATGAFIGGSTYALQAGANAYINSSSQWIYGGGSFGSSRYEQFNGAHNWYSAPAGTAGNAITFTQAMTLNASGNLLVGTTTAAGKVTFAGSGAASQTLTLNGTTTGANFARITSSGADAVLGIESSAGSAILSGSSANAMVLYTVGATPLQFGTNSSIRATIDSSGNLGLACTPSAWGTYKGLQVGGSAALWGPASTGSEAYLNANTYYNGTNRIYISTNFATEYSQSSGVHSWKTAASGTAGNTITFTQAMTLDASGNLGVGTTSPGAKLDVQTAGVGIQLKQSAVGSATYYVMDNTVETGGKRWRFGYTGAAGIPTFSLYNQTDNITAWVADAAGNLGLGVTPSAWSGVKAFEMTAGTSLGSNPTFPLTYLTANCFYNGSNWIYKTSNPANLYIQDATEGNHKWFNAPSGTAGNAITFTQAMTLTAAGNLGVGNSSPSRKLEVTGSGDVYALVETTGTTGTVGLLFGDSASDAVGRIEYVHSSDVMQFTTGGSEQMRLTSTGLGIGVTSPAVKLDVAGGSSADVISIRGRTSDNFGLLSFATSAGTKNAYLGSTDSTNLVFYTNGFNERARIDSSGNLLVGQTSQAQTIIGFSVTPAGIVSTAMLASTSAANSYHLYSTGAAAYRFYVGLNGTINATSTVITAISDQRLKENVRDIDTGLDSIMALKPRRFDWKEGKGLDKKNAAGFIAQEFETVFPECVSTTLPGGDGIEYKNINHETLIPTLVKAIQEQQVMIEDLKTRLAAAGI